MYISSCVEVQHVNLLLVSVFALSKYFAAVAAGNLVGPFWHQQVLLTVQALHKNFLNTELDQRFTCMEW